ncbi:bifunctional adenosylcobinamide kinase/adenosylcobinamide-phosphate guanylyltransferase [Sphingomonas yunnanensis]|uniref:bifunctional adenosylcobinamide kinase/adenosylcobinamide-phosphate guanylyltransferase n=1 Tax=Sphingomonas yunnanensis TaxID=310400 RepID=UPI001CA72BB5|nr:bifunctional adenosylcobinamide kinase/adenosylcobinamide-phosphate guanylyltransferase [Sphingomonas yunnanensis]MBY9061630.1 bifunctional adenosylcobinamide kinase/adenosylcobinamide-phosphate guanylyltransferase [Sphingomonas yunnanensis]
MIDTRVTLVLGGARSGKSRHAQARAEARGGALVFVATAQALDDEMRARVAQHRADRDSRWRTVEAPLALAETIVAEGRAGSVLLVDCLTLWASNLLLGEADAALALDALDAALRDTAARVVLVANEVGLGIVPDNALARRFRDLAGTINQRVAARADRVVFVAAGLPLVLK